VIARADEVIEGGIVSPSALAVFRLITSSNVVGCWTGRSGGLAPLRIFPVYMPIWRPGSREARSIGDQAADRGDFAPRIDLRNGMATRQRHEQLGCGTDIKRQ